MNAPDTAKLNDALQAVLQQLDEATTAQTLRKAEWTTAAAKGDDAKADKLEADMEKAARVLQRLEVQRDALVSQINDAAEYVLSLSGSGSDAAAAERGKAVFAEKIPEDPGFAIRRGIELKPGEKILVVEDVTTTGGSARKVVEMLKTIGCDPVAVGAVVDRSGGKASFDVPFINLLALNLETYEPDSCPLCEQGSAAIKPGSTIK